MVDSRPQVLLAGATPVGREAVEHLSRALHRVEYEWVSSLSPQEQETLLNLLERLRATMPAV